MRLGKNAAPPRPGRPERQCAPFYRSRGGDGRLAGDELFLPQVLQRPLQGLRLKLGAQRIPPRHRRASAAFGIRPAPPDCASGRPMRRSPQGYSGHAAETRRLPVKWPARRHRMCRNSARAQRPPDAAQHARAAAPGRAPPRRALSAGPSGRSAPSGITARTMPSVRRFDAPNGTRTRWPGCSVRESGMR